MLSANAMQLLQGPSIVAGVPTAAIGGAATAAKTVSTAAAAATMQVVSRQ